MGWLVMRCSFSLFGGVHCSGVWSTTRGNIPATAPVRRSEASTATVGRPRYSVPCRALYARARTDRWRASVPWQRRQRRQARQARRRVQARQKGTWSR